MEAGGNGNSRWMMNGNGNNCGIQMGTGMGMNEREWEGMGMKKKFPLISSLISFYVANALAGTRHTTAIQDKIVVTVTFRVTKVRHNTDILIKPEDNKAHAEMHGQS
jgi:hypothetical protein